MEIQGFFCYCNLLENLLENAEIDPQNIIGSIADFSINNKNKRKLDDFHEIIRKKVSLLDILLLEIKPNSQGNQ